MTCRCWYDAAAISSLIELAVQRQSKPKQPKKPKEPKEPKQQTRQRPPIHRPDSEVHEAKADEIVSCTSEDEYQGDCNYVVGEDYTASNKPADTGEYDENEMYQELGDSTA